MVIRIVLLTLAALLLAYVLLLVVSALLVNRRREYDRMSPFYWWLINSLVFLCMKLMRIRLEITGWDKLPAGEKFLMVCNHCSNFDPIVTIRAFRKHRLAFISKPENFRIPVAGSLVHRCCFMPINREDPKKALPTIQRAAKLLGEGEVSVGVYPEGTRSKSGGLLPFHNSVFKVAQRAKAPVVIVSLSGTQEIAGNFPWHASRVYLDILDVIPAEEVCREKTAEIGERVRREIEAKLLERKETENPHE